MMQEIHNCVNMWAIVRFFGKIIQVDRVVLVRNVSNYETRLYVGLEQGEFHYALLIQSQHFLFGGECIKGRITKLQ